MEGVADLCTRYKHSVVSTLILRSDTIHLRNNKIGMHAHPKLRYVSECDLSQVVATAVLQTTRANFSDHLQALKCELARILSQNAYHLASSKTVIEIYVSLSGVLWGTSALLLMFPGDLIWRKEADRIPS